MLPLTLLALFAVSAIGERLDIPSFAPSGQTSLVRVSHRQHLVRRAEPATQQPIELTEASLEAAAERLLAASGARLRPGMSIRLSDVHISDWTDVSHAYFRIDKSGREVANWLLNINIRDGVILSYGLEGGVLRNNTHRRQLRRRSPDTTVSLSDAVYAVISCAGLDNNLYLLPDNDTGSRTVVLGDTRDTDARHTATVTESALMCDGELVDTYRVEIPMLPYNYIHAQVDQSSGRVLMLNDRVSSAGRIPHQHQHRHPSMKSIRAWKLGNRAGIDPSKAQSQLVDIESARFSDASPFGWYEASMHKLHSFGGNNVVVVDGRTAATDASSNNTRTRLSRPLAWPVRGKMDYTFNPADEEIKSIHASAANVFYWGNLMHDIFYAHGFTPDTGNFQIAEPKDRPERGRNQDPVIIRVHTVYGNSTEIHPDIALFYAPKDGSPGRMDLFVNTLASGEKRDTSFSGDVLIHELTHGMTGRLIGGGGTEDCLKGDRRSEALAEGWSDFMSLALRVTPDMTRSTARFGFGEYATGKNIRKLIFSAVAGENKLSFKDSTDNRIHRAGAVWASVLYDIYWDLIDAYGFTDKWYTQGNDNLPGNILMLRLMIESLKLSPCRPSFLTSRDAILHADELGTQGSNECLLWKAFARRGMGVNALFEPAQWDKTGAKDHIIPSYEVPVRCQ